MSASSSTVDYWFCGRFQVEGKKMMMVMLSRSLPDSIRLCIVVCLSTLLTHPIVSNCLYPCLPHLSLSLFFLSARRHLSPKLCTRCGIGVNCWASCYMRNCSDICARNAEGRRKARKTGGGRRGILRICSAGKCLFSSFSASFCLCVTDAHTPTPLPFHIQV